jgi:hypothetical protein
MTTHTTIERKQEQNQHKHKDDNEINNETNVRKAADAGVRSEAPLDDTLRKLEQLSQWY